VTPETPAPEVCPGCGETKDKCKCAKNQLKTVTKMIKRVIRNEAGEATIVEEPIEVPVEEPATPATPETPAQPAEPVTPAPEQPASTPENKGTPKNENGVTVVPATTPPEQVPEPKEPKEPAEPKVVPAAPQNRYW
jgi:hypothetical protein